MNQVKEYFEETNIFIPGNSYLRKIQREAHKEIKEEFANDPKTHKIIVLPTGAGKTGVIALSPYKVCNGRVLVITPSLIIREGISDEFDTRTMYNFWSKHKVIIDDEKLPKVYRYAGYKTPADKKRIMKWLQETNIVIANIHKVYSTASNKTLVDILPPDFFDMIIIDEAHHCAADSWQKTLEYFEATKIIKLTATPFRADAKDLGGKIIYNYSLADAIKDGIIKNLVAEDITNENLEFEIDGRKVSKEEALEEMDNNWVTRSIAYSENCSRTIVERSIEILNEKRKLGNAFHQIIAVACSIEHAKQIKDLYAEYGIRAEYVSSDRQEDSEKAIIEYKKGSIDVIVNVNMLGEGFDHPNISIAAIFRPFRSLPPYAQFIGRALRKIQINDPLDNIDNIAHVVYHKELDLEELWQYYSNQKVKAQRRKVIEIEFSREEEQYRSRDVGEVIVRGKTISNVKTFLDDGIAHKYSKAIQKEIDEFENKLAEDIKKLKSELNMSDAEIADYEKARRKALEDKISTKRHMLRADLIREELQERHLDDIINRVEVLFKETELNHEGTELPSNTSNPYLLNSKDNKAYVRKYINNILKRKLKRGIDEWETYDFEEAQKALPEIIDKIKIKICEVKEERV